MGKPIYGTLYNIKMLYGFFLLLYIIRFWLVKQDCISKVYSTYIGTHILEDCMHIFGT